MVLSCVSTMKERTKKKWKKPLTTSEIETAVDKIRQKYNDYIIQYMKPLSSSQGFEDRYIEALRNRTNMEVFLHVEISVLAELVRREEDELRKKQAERTRRARKIKRGGEDFADRVLKELKKKIEKYPSIQLHQDASFEMQKLCGFLSHFYLEYFFTVENIIRGLSFSRTVHGLAGIASALADFYDAGEHKEPRAFSRYINFLSDPMRDYYAIDREEKRILLESAKILHSIHDALKATLDAGKIPEEEGKTVEKVLNVVHNGIEDFRLKDLKPRT